MTRAEACVEPLLSNLSKNPRLPKGAEDVIRRSISHGEHSGRHHDAGRDGQPGTVCISGLADDQ